MLIAQAGLWRSAVFLEQLEFPLAVWSAAAFSVGVDEPMVADSDFQTPRIESGYAAPKDRIAREGLEEELCRLPLATAADWSRQFSTARSALRPGSGNKLYAVDRSTVPPVADRSRRYTVLVPAVEADGNEVAGVRAPVVAVPLGT